MSKRNALDKSVYIFFGIVLLIAGVTLIIKNLNNDSCEELTWKITPEQVAAGDVVYFVDETPGANSWAWDFGDSTATNLSRATHVFKKEGTYAVVLKVNGKCVEVRQVKVKAARIVEEVPVIQGPAMAFVGKPVRFKVISATAKNWEWSFEEPSHIDSRDAEPSYIFKTPGIKNLVVFINNRTSKVTHEIEILASTPQKFTEGDFIVKLHQVMTGKAKPSSFLSHLCSLKIMVKVNTEAPLPFSSYCDRIRANEVTISAVKWHLDPGRGCMDYLFITQK